MNGFIQMYLSQSDNKEIVCSGPIELSVIQIKQEHAAFGKAQTVKIILCSMCADRGFQH